MKKVLIIASALLISINTFAQTDAKKILDEVTTKVKSFKNFQLDFTYTINGKTNKGNIAVENSKYLINFMGMTQIFDGSSTYLISPADKEVAVSKGANDALTLSKVLSFYTTGYSYKVDAKKVESGKNIQYIKLTPTQKNTEVKEVLLGIDTQNKMIYKKIDVLKNGTKNTLTINNFKTNQSFSKNHFTFTKSKYPNYYINHLD